VNGRLEPELWAHVCVTPSANAEDGSRSADVTLLDEAGAAVVEIRGLRLQAVARTAPETKEASETTEPNVESDLRQRLVASPPDKRLQTMMDFLRREIAIVAGLSPDEAFDLGATLVEVGLTSLMATELQYRIQKGLGVKLESRAPIDLESVETLAESLLKIALEPPRAPAKPRKGGSPATAAATETTSAESEE
jgi:hypothetical protein